MCIKVMKLLSLSSKTSLIPPSTLDFFDYLMETTTEELLDKFIAGFVQKFQLLMVFLVEKKLGTTSLEKNLRTPWRYLCRKY